ncbi:MAG: monovalent cation/H+ antiporter complex subunit F [Chloroflexota bacterium]|nr:monovalent cation/H+ antiporter complex subunit F [Chloroflexota bacterium]
MGAVTTIALLLLGIAIVGCLYRVVVGPSVQDRALALDSVVICVMTSMVVIAIKYSSGFFLDVALVTAVISFISTIAIAKFLIKGKIID